MIRSEPPLPIELDDSLSVPKPELVLDSDPKSLLIPVPMSIEGIVGVSAGRATGLAPPSEPPLRDRAGFELDRLAGLRLEALRPLLVVRALLRLAGAFFLPLPRVADARFAVLRLAVLRLAVDFLAVDRLPADRLLVDFFVDFFFAAIDPPCMRVASRA